MGWLPVTQMLTEDQGQQDEYKNKSTSEAKMNTTHDEKWRLSENIHFSHIHDLPKQTFL